MNKFEKVSLEQFKKDVIKYINVESVYEGIKIPSRSTKLSAGYDFYLPYPIMIRPHETVTVATGIKCSLNPDCVLLMDVRSSVGIKHGVTLSNTIGVIDADYYNNPENEGHIFISLKNNGREFVNFNEGDRIAQGIIVKYETTDDDSADGERNGGIGSTG